MFGLPLSWCVTSFDVGLSLTLFFQMDDSEGTVRQIGAFSEGIQNLTVRIQRVTR